MLEKLKGERSRKVIIVLLALFVTFALSVNLDIVNNSDVKGITSNTSHFIKILLKLNYSIDRDIFKSLLMFMFFVMLFNKTFFNKNKEKKSILLNIVPLMFSFFMVFGYSFMKINSWDMIFINTLQLFKAIIVFIGYFILFKAIINYLLFTIIPKIEKKKIKNSASKIYEFIFVKHSFIMPLVIILICWLPYIIAYFPGIIMQDSAAQIKQFYGYDIPESSSTNSINLIDENVKITNHHPVIHTVILGTCMQIGKLIGSDNLGVFIYTFLQIMIFSSALSYIIHFTKKLSVPYYIRIIILFIFALLPIIPIYSLLITKDILFASFLLIYITKIYDMIKSANKEKYNWKQISSIIILGLAVTLFRNNGIYVIILSLPFIAIVDKINRKSILVISAVVILIYECFTSILLPILKISPSSVREVLSVPFQQTARYVKEHESEITKEEKEAIDKVLNYNTLAKRYNPVHADSVKNKYNKDATKQDLSNYFKVWCTGLFKHPTTYIQATMNNTYGYFYPEADIKSYTTTYIVNSEQSLNETNNFNYHYIESLKKYRNIIKEISMLLQKLPITSWIINPCLNAWLMILILTYLIYRKKYRYIIYLMPFISILLINILSPVNTYFRYAMPYIFGMPLTIAIFIDIIKQNKIIENKERKNSKNEK